MSSVSPTMRRALRALDHSRLVHRPRELPGGQSTCRALIKRGLAEQDGSWVRLTDLGRQLLERGR